jgi:hypothetical protein
MQTRNEIIEFLSRIDKHVARPFELKLIGKSALILAGLEDSVGTADIDSLRVDGDELPEADKRVIAELESEFGRAKLAANGYFLQFVSEAIVFLPQNPTWVPLKADFTRLSVYFLEPHCIVASKFFSAFTAPPRKKDQQDIVATLDQDLVDFAKVASLADQIFDFHSMDSRNSRFSRVHQYILTLMDQYGHVPLKFEPGDEH